MYSHLLKGGTVGQVVARRVFRNITGIPGALADFVAAVFWQSETGNYSAYWDENEILYADGTRERGFFRGVTGWVGDIFGTVLGTVVGTFVGGVLYFPDAIVLRTLPWLHDKIHDGFDFVANGIGRHSFFNDFNTFPTPENYMQKAWNISAGVLGVAIAAIPYIAAKTVEFVFPFLGNGLSTAVKRVSGFVGGVVGSAIAIAAYPAKYLINRTVDLFKGVRDKVRSVTAWIYAKTNQEPLKKNDRNAMGERCCLPSATMHSQQFRDQVAEFKRSSTAELLLGPLNNNGAGIEGAVAPIQQLPQQQRPVVVASHRGYQPVSQASQLPQQQGYQLVRDGEEGAQQVRLN
jgi:gas vesicle protein